MKVRNRMEEKHSLSFWSDCILLAKYDVCQQLLCWPQRHKLVDALEMSGHISYNNISAIITQLASVTSAR